MAGTRIGGDSPKKSGSQQERDAHFNYATKGAFNKGLHSEAAFKGSNKVQNRTPETVMGEPLTIPGTPEGKRMRGRTRSQRGD